MLILRNLCIDLDNTLLCGQCFRWVRQADGSFCGNVEGKAVRAEVVGGDLVLHGAKAEEEAFWRHYFDADADYGTLLCCEGDAPLREAVCACPGVRVLNQPFWETLCCFILSSNNNIARITKITERFCAIGERDANGLHAFPTPQMVVEAGREWLDGIGAGYRAKYLWAAAERMVGRFDAEMLKSMDYETAAASLRTFYGVGEKVADCVLLFACEHREAFPVDTWVEKMLTQWYGMEGSRSKLKAQAMQRFGAYGGLKQQVLFLHAMREKLSKEQQKDGRTDVKL